MLKMPCIRHGVDSQRHQEQIRNKQTILANDMLDQPQPRPAFRNSFDQWWNAQTAEFQSRTDVRAAWTIFQAGYTAGGRKTLKRYIFRAGRFKITRWASNLAEAKKEAIIEADYRVALRGGKRPAGGWKMGRL